MIRHVPFALQFLQGIEFLEYLNCKMSREVGPELGAKALRI